MFGKISVSLDGIAAALYVAHVVFDRMGGGVLLVGLLVVVAAAFLAGFAGINEDEGKTLAVLSTVMSILLFIFFLFWFLLPSV